MTARSVLITGGAGGLGLAMARGLLDDGHRVALLDRDAEAIARAEAALAGREVLALRGDVSVEADCRRAVDAVAARLGPVEVLVNNAGVGPSSIRPDPSIRPP